MSKAILLLEAMAQLAHADIDKLIAQTTITTEQAEAIRTKDIISLERQLDICPDIFCFLIPAEDDEPVKEDEENEESSIKSVVNW